MSASRTLLVCAAALATLVGCATVRQQDLDAWAGVPVQALDAHPLFASMPMYKTLTDSGVEIRNYANSKDFEQCFASRGIHHGSSRHTGYADFISCSENHIICNNLFYIENAKVIRYAPTGNCYTDDSVRPRAAIGGASAAG